MAILSIQSHVVYGYVGNKAAVFPLQSMGYDVWPVNTVQFSNHTGYGTWQGEIFSKEHIRNVVQGLDDIGVMDQCQAILSGYMGSSDTCHEVFDIVQKVKSKNPQCIYLCDPVIGDTSCYVKPEVREFFKGHLLADIITPNQFEAEVLSGVCIKSFADVKNAAQYFHNRGIGMVIIKGIKVHDLPADGLYVFISDSKSCHLVKTKKYPFAEDPSGTGDLLSAIFLGSYLKTRDPLAALKQTIVLMDCVMQNTFENKSKELMVTSIDYRRFDGGVQAAQLQVIAV